MRPMKRTGKAPFPRILPSPSQEKERRIRQREEAARDWEERRREREAEGRADEGEKNPYILGEADAWIDLDLYSGLESAKTAAEGLADRAWAMRAGELMRAALWLCEASGPGAPGLWDDIRGRVDEVAEHLADAVSGGDVAALMGQVGEALLRDLWAGVGGVGVGEDAAHAGRVAARAVETVAAVIGRGGGAEGLGEACVSTLEEWVGEQHGGETAAGDVLRACRALLEGQRAGAGEAVRVAVRVATPLCAPGGPWAMEAAEVASSALERALAAAGGGAEGCAGDAACRGVREAAATVAEVVRALTGPTSPERVRAGGAGCLARLYAVMRGGKRRGLEGAEGGARGEEDGEVRAVREALEALALDASEVVSRVAAEALSG